MAPTAIRPLIDVADPVQSNNSSWAIPLHQEEGPGDLGAFVLTHFDSLSKHYFPHLPIHRGKLLAVNKGQRDMLPLDRRSEGSRCVKYRRHFRNQAIRSQEVLE